MEGFDKNQLDIQGRGRYSYRYHWLRLRRRHKTYIQQHFRRSKQCSLKNTTHPTYFQANPSEGFAWMSLNPLVFEPAHQPPQDWEECDGTYQARFIAAHHRIHVLMPNKQPLCCFSDSQQWSLLIVCQIQTREQPQRAQEIVRNTKTPEKKQDTAHQTRPPNIFNKNPTQRNSHRETRTKREASITIAASSFQPPHRKGWFWEQKNLFPQPYLLHTKNTFSPKSCRRLFEKVPSLG